MKKLGVRLRRDEGRAEFTVHGMWHSPLSLTTKNKEDLISIYTNDIVNIIV